MDRTLFLSRNEQHFDPGLVKRNVLTPGVEFILHSTIWRFVTGSYRKEPRLVSSNDVVEEVCFGLTGLEEVFDVCNPVLLFLIREIVCHKLRVGLPDLLHKQ